MKTTGTITEILEMKSGISKATQKEWKTQSFVIDNNEEYNNILCLEVFGEEKVTNLTKYNKVGDVVEVEFNVSSRSWTNPKTNKTSWFTKADAWKITKVKQEQGNIEESFDNEKAFDIEQESDLPF